MYGVKSQWDAKVVRVKEAREKVNKYKKSGWVERSRDQKYRIYRLISRFSGPNFLT